MIQSYCIIYHYIQQQDMSKQRGISVHLEKFYTTELSSAQQPNISILASIKALNQIIKMKQADASDQIEARSHIAEKITLQQAEELKQCRAKIKENQQILKVMEICRDIDIKILGFEDNIQAVDFDQFHRLKERLGTFRDLYQLIEKLDTVFGSIEVAQQKKQVDPNFRNQQVGRLKLNYFDKLKSKLYKAIVQLFYSHNRISKVEFALEYFGLPIKKNVQGRNKDQIKQIVKRREEDYLNNSYIIIQALFCEYCCYCLQKKIQMVLGQEEQQLEGTGINVQNLGEFSSQYFSSPFFARLWHKVAKSIIYIFINSPNMNHQSNGYQIDEPNWLFDYMDESFKFNLSFISENILSLMKDHVQTNEVVQSIQTFFINYSYKYFFLKFIVMRLESDLQVLKEKQKAGKTEVQEQSNKIGFLIFNFLDQLHILQQKLYQAYDHEPNFIESVLLWSVSNSTLDILNLNFDYEHYWIEQRIFSDFHNINYSSITDLKNIQAYNIAINFIHIFQKLYSKFRKVMHEELKSKINQFYYGELLQLIRHIKTSFERIYNYSGIDKYEILISYKKIENQFKGYFDGFIKQSPTFELKIQEEYYSVLEKYTSVLALEELTNVHKKLYKRLSDLNDYFCGQITEINDKDGIKKKWTKIFQQWQQKLSKIHKIQPQYEDKKLRNIFFVFIENIHFSEDGFYFFLSIFEPFLIVLFSMQGVKILKMLLEMEKNTLKQYCKVHNNNLLFLTSTEIKSIQKIRIRQKIK